MVRRQNKTGRKTRKKLTEEKKRRVSADPKRIRAGGKRRKQGFVLLLHRE